MKKLLVLTFAAALTLGVYAKPTVKTGDDEKEITYVVKKQFGSQFATAKDVSWTTNSQTLQAKFTLNERKMTAYYDFSGKYIGSTQFVSFDQLPYKASKEVAENYKDFSPAYTIQIAERPEYSDYNDTGVFYVTLIGATKEVHLRVSPSGEVSVYKELQLASR